MAREIFVLSVDFVDDWAASAIIAFTSLIPGLIWPLE